jgi:hypothetical protein
VCSWFGPPRAALTRPAAACAAAAPVSVATGVPDPPARINGTIPAPSRGPVNVTCPTITLRLNSIEIYDASVTDPQAVFSVQCYTRDGYVFRPVQFSSQSATARGETGARYVPEGAVAQLSCGGEVSCSVGTAGAMSTAWEVLADGGCWFDYRHFVQRTKEKEKNSVFDCVCCVLSSHTSRPTHPNPPRRAVSFQEPGSAWICSKLPVRYTLDCVECQQPSFPWQAAAELAGPELADPSISPPAPASTINSTVVIIAVAFASLVVVAFAVGVIVHGRRRAAAEDERSMELVAQAQAAAAAAGGRRRSGSRPHKPAAMFMVGPPREGPLPPQYHGPIVVVQPGFEGPEAEQSGEAGEASALSPSRSSEGRGGAAPEMLCWRVAIAQPEAPSPVPEADAEAGEQPETPPAGDAPPPAAPAGDAADVERGEGGGGAAAPAAAPPRGTRPVRVHASGTARALSSAQRARTRSTRRG